MALVAAYSSDSDSDVNDDREIANDKMETNLSQSNKEKESTNIEVDLFDIVDEENWEPSSECTKNALFVHLPEPKDQPDDVIHEDLDDEFIKKKAPANVEQPKTDKNKLNIFPKRDKGRKKDPVKITVPSLKDFSDDSDSDGGNEASNRPTVAAKKSSLFSMLPKPRHSVTVGDNRNRVFQKEASRSLIPHTLTKKTEPAKTNTDKNHGNNNKNGGVVVEDDDDEEMVVDNFFSLGSNLEEKVKSSVKATLQNVVRSFGESSPNANVADTQSNEISVGVGKKTPMKTETKNPQLELKGNAYFAKFLKSTNSKSLEGKPAIKKNDNGSSTISDRPLLVRHNNVTAPYGTQSDVTAPYGTQSNVTAPYGSSPYQSHRLDDIVTTSGTYGSRPVTGTYNSNANTIGTLYPSSDNHSTKHFFLRTYSGINESQSKPSEEDYYKQPNEDLPLDQSALIALQGRKRRREEVNIIDVKADDIQGDNTSHLKNLTVETTYKSKKSQQDEPNRQQRNKHQITYLAFQAKEREFELRQQWAENRSTKQQTQSRYGF